VIQNQWKLSQAGQRAVITVPGGFDITSASGLSQAVATALEAGAAEVIVDTTGARRCSLTGIAALARARRRAEAAGSVLRIVAGPAVRQAMTSTGPVTRTLLPLTTSLAVVPPARRYPPVTTAPSQTRGAP
jgi:anti-anti-sigma regulatory factor